MPVSAQCSGGKATHILMKTTAMLETPLASFEDTQRHTEQAHCEDCPAVFVSNLNKREDALFWYLQVLYPQSQQTLLPPLERSEIKGERVY